MSIYATFQFADGEDKDDIKELLKKFSEHFTPKVNETVERYNFQKRNQRERETSSSTSPS